MPLLLPIVPVHALKALLIIINSGPLVNFPTITDFEFAIIPEDKNGVPPLTVTGSTCTCNDSEITLISSSVAFGYIDTCICCYNH